MAASTSFIDTPEFPVGTHAYPVAAATTIPGGVIGALDASGNAVNASDAAALKVIGRAEGTADNSAGSAGDVSVTIKRGTFRWANSATNPLTKAHVGRVCYVEDNQTVASTSTNKCKAGIVVLVDDDGVWVNTAPGLQTTATQVVALTSTDGTAAAASASLANLAAEAEKIGDDVRAIHAALQTVGILK